MYLEIKMFMKFYNHFVHSLIYAYLFDYLIIQSVYLENSPS